ncbi:MAG TPA: TraR/DksA C4-type zinc finger protein [Acidimicrobiia bacterium]|nr:TraR/DksA C4-type zinc finger protein [Acidimicrobiia bacterium]
MARAGASKSLDQRTPKARGAPETATPTPVKAATKVTAKVTDKAVRKKVDPPAVAPKPVAKVAKPAANAGKAVKAAPVAKSVPTRRNSEVAQVAEAPKGKRAATATKTPSKAAAAATPEKSEASAGLPPKTLDKLRRLLQEERETYVRQAHDLAAEAEALAAEREPGDTQFDEESGEGDTVNVERERDLALSASATQAVEDIDRALHRMETGAFGICERCGKKITVARLEALPFAALCIECKSREERRR